MPSARRVRRSVVALLFFCSLVLIIVAADGWSGPVPATITFAAVFLGPGVGWQNLRGTLRLTPAGLGLAVATSIGAVVVLGLLMNAFSISLTRAHWAAVLAIVLGAIAFRTALRRDRAAGARPRPGRASRRQSRARAAAPLVAVCTILGTTGALIAWYSQQHWLARQHYTELYATAVAGGREIVTVHNHEGQAVAYTARIAVAGQAATIMPFSLANGGTWTRTVTVGTASPSNGRPVLDVELSRLGVPGVYRFIRLLRLQPTAQPTP